MIKGIGTDIVEISRIEKLMHKSQFVERILTFKEREVFDAMSFKRQLEFLAGRFAAKEAVAKALGTGIGDISFQDIEILNSVTGQPQIKIKNSRFATDNYYLSISHSIDYAVAFALVEEQ